MTKIVFICSEGVSRSKTAAELFKSKYMHDTSYFGIESRYLNEKQLILKCQQADVVICMESIHKKLLEQVLLKHGIYLEYRPIVLYYQDIFKYNSPELINLLEQDDKLKEFRNLDESVRITNIADDWFKIYCNKKFLDEIRTSLDWNTMNNKGTEAMIGIKEYIGEFIDELDKGEIKPEPNQNTYQVDCDFLENDQRESYHLNGIYKSGEPYEAVMDAYRWAKSRIENVKFKSIISISIRSLHIREIDESGIISTFTNSIFSWRFDNKETFEESAKRCLLNRKYNCFDPVMYVEEQRKKKENKNE